MYIAGADLFVRRDAFCEAGKFDENIFMYYEEPDLIRRLRKVKKDCKIVYEPESNDSSGKEEYADVYEYDWARNGFLYLLWKKIWTGL